MEQRGFKALRWDINRGAAWDLALPSNQQLVRGWIAEGLVSAVHLGTPCGTLTRARDRGPVKAPGQRGWPSGLRSDKHAWGLPEVVNPADLVAISLGNTLAMFSASVLEVCLIYQFPCTIENPHGSRLWPLPPIVKLSRNPRWRAAVADFCQSGKPRKKPTRFAGFFIDLQSLERRCSARARCSRTHKPHQSLQGIAPNGKMWTKEAEPYPAPLCRILAQCFDNAMATQRTRRLATL